MSAPPPSFPAHYARMPEAVADARCSELAVSATQDRAVAGAALLRDLRALFRERGTERLPTEEIVAALAARRLALSHAARGEAACGLAVSRPSQRHETCETAPDAGSRKAAGNDCLTVSPLGMRQ